MKHAWIGAALLVASPALASEDDRAAGRPGSSDATLELSFARFEQYFDERGRSRRLDDAFGAGAKNVAVDSLLFQFGGRYVLGPGLEARVDVPLVRTSRSGQVETLLTEESLYAESMAVGDVTGSARFEIPLGGGEVESAFGVGGLLKAPTGIYEGVEQDQMPTGGGDWGIGGELFVVVRPMRAEIGGAASMLLLLPHERDEREVDRGDARAFRAWAALPLGSRGKAGLRFHALLREADRVEGVEVRDLPEGAQPGALVPESRLLSAAPYVELTPARNATVVLSAGAPATSWLFLPAETGFPLSGKNVMLTRVQARVFLLTEF